MEGVFTAEDATGEDNVDDQVDDYIDSTKDDEVAQGEEVTAYYTNIEQGSAELRDTAFPSREKADCIIDEMFSGLLSDGNFYKANATSR
jgi:hypothetical protein